MPNGTGENDIDSYKKSLVLSALRHGFKLGNKDETNPIAILKNLPQSDLARVREIYGCPDDVDADTLYELILGKMQVNMAEDLGLERGATFEAIRQKDMTPLDNSEEDMAEVED